MECKGCLHYTYTFKKDTEWYIPGVTVVPWTTVFVSPFPHLFYKIFLKAIRFCLFNKGDEDYSSYSCMMTYQHTKSEKLRNWKASMGTNAAPR